MHKVNEEENYLSINLVFFVYFVIQINVVPEHFTSLQDLNEHYFDLIYLTSVLSKYRPFQYIPIVSNYPSIWHSFSFMKVKTSTIVKIISSLYTV
jgi:hypothetical protein